LETIYGRRSIRKYKADEVPRETIEKILAAATKAPSAMNRQPWRFVVLEGQKKDEVCTILQKRIAKLKKLNKEIGGAQVTVAHMKEAPVLILIYNGKSRAKGMTQLFSTVLHVFDVQSVGAAIQNMLLAAQELGLGTLWIGHVFWAVKAIGRHLHQQHELIAAVSVGWPDESPPERPREGWQEVTAWMK
jgi:nitroreductase